MADIDTLKTARSNAITRLAEVLATPKPSYNIDGQSIDWNGYVAQLRESIRALDAMIATESGEGFGDDFTQAFT